MPCARPAQYGPVRMADHRDVRTRVLWLIKGLGPGGAERLLVDHARLAGCDALSFAVAYLLPWKEHLAPELAALGVATHCLDVRSVADPRWVYRLRQLVRTSHIDVVHAHSPALASCARLALRTCRPRPALVYTEHNRWPSYRAATRVANRATIGLDDATIAVSDDVRASMGRAGDKTQVLTHGVDVDRIRAQRAERGAVRAELGVPIGETLVVTVANLRAGKAYGDLLTAARQVLDIGEPFVFVAAGQGPQESELRALHDHLGLGDRFRFLGYVENASRLTAAADLFVLASVHEGLPVAVMEALALGVPVVATRAGGVPELVESGSSGLLVEPGHPDQLAAAIRAAAEPGTRTRLAEGAARRGSALDARPSVERLDRMYLELATSRAPEPP
jgi:glycosyltransferase involved in cell wall biosynthesis